MIALLYGTRGGIPALGMLFGLNSSLSYDTLGLQTAPSRSDLYTVGLKVSIAHTLGVPGVHSTFGLLRASSRKQLSCRRVTLGTLRNLVES